MSIFYRKHLTKSFEIKALILICLAVVDAVSTSWFISTGKAIEANPVLSWIEDPGQMMAAKLLYSLLCIIGVMLCDKTGKYLTAAIIAYVLVYITGSMGVNLWTILMI